MEQPCGSDTRPQMWVTLSTAIPVFICHGSELMDLATGLYLFLEEAG